MPNTIENTTINGLGHIALNVRNMDRTLNFYCKVLGLKHAFTLRDSSGEPTAEYVKASQNNFIELLYPRKGIELLQDTGRTTFSHICLTVSDIHAAEKAIVDAGWPIATKLKQVDSNWMLFVKDPDGNRVELTQISPDSPQAKA